MKISWIGIIGQELERDLWGTLERMASIGYQGLESGLATWEKADLPPEEIRKRLEGMGLALVAVGLKKQDFESGQGRELVRKVKAMGCNRVVFYWGPVLSKEQLLRDAESYNEIGKLCFDEGVELLYHNHDHEFKKIDGVYAWDILMAHTDPRYVKALLDTAWVFFGGADPVELVKRYAGRCPVLHMKDFVGLEPGCERAEGDRKSARFTEVGTGVVPVKEIVEAARSAGVEWLTVEQDRPRELPPMESVRTSLENLRKFV